MITLRPEAYDQGIRSMVFQELTYSFIPDTGYWRDKEQSRTAPFMKMVSDLGKVSDGGANDVIEERIFTQLKRIASAAGFPENEKAVAAEYTELFFSNVEPTISNSRNRKGPYYRVTSRKLIERLCTLAVQEETNIKTRVAAYRLLSQLTNPYTQKQFDSYKAQNPAVKKGLEEFGSQVAELSVDFPEPPQQSLKSISLTELGKIVLDGALIKGDSLLITLKDAQPLVVGFASLNNLFSPNILFGTVKGNPEIQHFGKDQIQTIEIVEQDLFS